MSERKRYSKEFKNEAVGLLRTSGKTSLEIAKDFGINRDNFVDTKRQLNIGNVYEQIMDLNVL